MAESGAYTLADLVRKTGAKRRSAQLWAEAGVLQAAPSTEHGGSGVHRVFDDVELTIAKLVAPLARLGITIGSLRYFSDYIRPILRGNVPPPQEPWDPQPDQVERWRRIFERAHRGEGLNLLGAFQRGPRLSFAVAAPTSDAIRWDAQTWGVQVDNVRGQMTILLDLNDLMREA